MAGDAGKRENTMANEQRLLLRCQMDPRWAAGEISNLRRRMRVWMLVDLAFWVSVAVACLVVAAMLYAKAGG